MNAFAKFDGGFVLNETTCDLQDAFLRGYSTRTSCTTEKYSFLKACNTSVESVLTYAIRQLEYGLQSKDVDKLYAPKSNDFLERLLLLFDNYGYPPQYWNLILQYLPLEWHQMHEDIVWNIQMAMYEPAAEVLAQCVTKQYDCYDEDESASFASKCVYALGAIRTPLAMEKIKQLAQIDSREYVLESVEKNLEIFDRGTIREGITDSIYMLLNVPLDYGFSPAKNRFLNEYPKFANKITKLMKKLFIKGRLLRDSDYILSAVGIARAFGCDDGFLKRITKMYKNKKLQTSAIPYISELLGFYKYEPAVNVLKEYVWNPTISPDDDQTSIIARLHGTMEALAAINYEGMTEDFKNILLKHPIQEIQTQAEYYLAKKLRIS